VEFSVMIDAASMLASTVEAEGFSATVTVPVPPRTASDPAHDEALGAEADKGMHWIDPKCAHWRDKRVIDDAAAVSVGSFAHMPLLAPGSR
jgi:hypothetical protein